LVGLYRLALILGLTYTLAACGGGGGGGSGSGSGSNTIYTVGGSLTGLPSGQQLNLQNGNHVLVISANGTFTFGEQLPSGASYSVTVAEPLPWGTCVVANGSGTVAGGNVNNITVTCTAYTYSISGNLIGLASGQHVTVQNNGADSLTLTADGSFTFATRLTYGGNYAVSVVTQPDQASQQFCVVTNGTSYISSGDVTNVRVGCNTEVTLDTTTGDNGPPNGTVVSDSAGNVYGTVYGSVFKLSPAPGGIYSQMVIGTPGGAFGGVILDTYGNLYGSTQSAVFKLTPSPDGTYAQTVLVNFGGLSGTGGTMSGGIAMDSSGNLYGMSSQYGPNGVGFVFKLTPSGGGAYTESTLYSFTGGVDGAHPSGGVTVDRAGNLYGITTSGGSSVDCSGGCGTIFKLSPLQGGGYAESIIHMFAGTDLGAPGPVALDGAGNLYGTTPGGGGYRGGSVYKLSAADGSYSVLYSFTGGADGAGPNGGLVIDGAGNMYGTTSSGGGSANCNNGCGTLYKLSASAGTYAVQYNFLGDSSQALPVNGLSMDSAGNVYGTTGNFSTGSGTVYELLLP
jgi:uncharacterized repeat protein (TIGR03803 family)